MPEYITWDELIKTDGYRALDDNQKAEARAEYYENVIKPQVPIKDQVTAREEFFAVTDELAKDPFNSLRDDEVELLKSRGLLNTTSEEWEKEKRQSERGIANAALRGRFGSTTARLTKDYLPDTDAAQGIKDFEASGYQPETYGEKVAYGIGSIAADLPLYALGGKIVGLGGGGALLQSGGSFALPAGINKMLDIKEQKGSVGLEDIPEVLLDEAKGMGTGIAVGAAGKFSKALTNPINNKFVRGATDFGTSTTAETAALLGSEKVLHDRDITAESFGEALGTIGVMKLLHANPFSKSALESAASERGLTQEQIAKNIRPEHLEHIKNPEAAKVIVEEAAVRTVKEIEAQKTASIQNEIINRQIQANYKEGKTPEEVLQINQVPTEYRKFLIDSTPDGNFKFKPEVLEAIRVKTDKEANPFRDELPDTFKTPEQSRVEQYKKLKESINNHEMKLIEINGTAEALKQKFIDDHFAALHKRRFEDRPVVRKKLDAILNAINNNTKLTDQVKYVENPDITKLSLPEEYSKLSPKYQKSLEKEILSNFIKNTQVVPEYLQKAAEKNALVRLNIERNKINQPLNQLKNEMNIVKRDPDFIEAVKAENYLRADDAGRIKQIEPVLEDISTKAEVDLIKAKEYYQSNLMKALGEDPSFGILNRSNEEFFGKDHVKPLIDFMKKSDTEIAKVLNNADYLDTSYNPKLSFTNSSRVIGNKMGEGVKRLFIDPLRQAEHNFVVEDAYIKQWIKANKKNLSPKERIEVGIHLLSKQEQGQKTFDAMNEKTLRKYLPEGFEKASPEQQAAIKESLLAKHKDKLITSKKYEELSEKQQQAVDEMRAILDVTYERVNAARAEAGIEPLEKVDNYFTFIRKFSTLEEFGFNILTVKPEFFKMEDITDFPSKSFSFKYGKERVESVRDLELDPFYILDKYMSNTLRTAHMTPVVGRLRRILDNNEKFQLDNQNAYEYLSDTLNYVAGKKFDGTYKSLNNAANKINRNLGIFILSWNFQSMIIQPTALVNTVAKLKPAYVSKGLKDFLNPEMKKFALEKSKVLKARMHDITVAEMTQGLYGKFGKAKEKVAEIGTLPLRYLDLKTAQVSWLSAYRYATEHLKMNEKEAVLFSDDVVISSQGSASRIDLAPIQRTPLGKSLTLFNTFVINNLHFLAEDVTGVKTHNKLIKTDVSKEDAVLYTDNKYTKNFVGDGKYNIYERQRMLSTPDAIEKVITYAVAAAVVNSVYELMGIKSPMPAPISAGYEAATGQSWVDTIKGKHASKKEAQLTDILLAEIREFASIVPVAGGAPRYGGASLGGAVWALVGETFDTIAQRPGCKPVPYILTKWAGVPGGQQIYKTIKNLDKVRKAEVTEMRHAADPFGQIRREMDKNNEYKQFQKEFKKEVRGY